MLNQDPANLRAIFDHRGISDWLRENDPETYSLVAGGPGPAAYLVGTPKRAPDFSIDDHVRRINHSLESDPAQALGSTKELIETVLKTILEQRGIEHTADDLPKLLKKTQAVLGLDPKDVVASAPGSETYRRLLGSIAQVVISVNELRNLYGTGHGRSSVPVVDAAAIRLAVGAGTALAAFLMERHQKLRGRA